MADPDWRAVRADYPGALTRTYLDTALKGIPPPAAVEAVGAFCRFVRECPGRSATDDSLTLIERLESVRATAARLLGGAPDEVAIVESTQHGMNVLADALQLRPGDRVVSDELEFFAAVLPWRELGRRGVALDLVPARDGRVLVEDVEAALAAGTRVVCVSSVQEVNGDRLDLAALGRLCRGRGVVLVVDATQHAGAAPLDVGSLDVDAVVVGAHKWLCSPFGAGLLWVRRDLLATLAPSLRGYMSLATPPGGWDRYLADPDRRPGAPLSFVEDARVLETGGTAPYAGAIALEAAVAHLLALGLDAVHSRVRDLVDLLVTGLAGLDVELTSPVEPERRAGIVVLRTGRGIDADRRLHEALLDAGISVSLRFTAGVGGIRVAPYYYNDEEDVARLLDVVSDRLRYSPLAPRPPTGRTNE